MNGWMHETQHLGSHKRKDLCIWLHKNFKTKIHLCMANQHEQNRQTNVRNDKPQKKYQELFLCCCLRQLSLCSSGCLPSHDRPASAS
jgi:hypothetical protein